MPFARITDPQTSHDAADSVRNLTGTQKAIALLIESEPMTDEALVTAYNLLAGLDLAPVASPSGIRSRRAELVTRGVIKDSGMRQKLASGRHAIVWVKP